MVAGKHALVRAVRTRIACRIMDKSLPLTLAKLISRVRFASDKPISATPPIAALAPALIDLKASHSSVRGFALSILLVSLMTPWRGWSAEMRRSENWCARVSGKTRKVQASLIACWQEKGIMKMSCSRKQVSLVDQPWLSARNARRSSSMDTGRGRRS